MTRILFHTLLVTLLLASMGGCTTIHSVGGGSGEFYVAAQKSFLVFPGQNYVLHCREVADADGITVKVECQRVLLGTEVGQLNPASGNFTKTFLRLE